MYRRCIHLCIGLFTALLIWFGTAASFAYEPGTRLAIPAIGVEAPIVPIPIRDLAVGVTWDTSQLNMSVGFLELTAWFGSGGNTVLGGHSELSRGQEDIFYYLDLVEVGDEIIISVDGREIQYTVARIFTVDQYDLQVVMPTVHDQLTLITCDVDSYNTVKGEYHDRIVVVAYPS